MSIHGAKHGTLLDPRGAEPVFQRPDGAVNRSAERDADLTPHAVLVSLRPPDGQNDPLPDPLEVNEVNGSKFGASEAACKSDQQQSAVSEVLEPITHHPKNDEEVLTEKRSRLTLCCPVFTPYTPHCGPH